MASPCPALAWAAARAPRTGRVQDGKDTTPQEGGRRLLVASTRDDVYRAHLNAKLAPSDRIGALVTAVLLLTLIWFKVLGPGLFGVAAVGASHVAFLSWGASFIGRRRSTYLAHRELLVCLALLNMTVASRGIASWGIDNLFMHHGGSALRLAALHLISGSALYAALYALYARLLLRWICLVLPPAVLIPLLWGRSLCSRMVEIPGVDAPLRELFHTLEAFHAAPVTPALVPPARGVPEPVLQQCLVFDCFVISFVGLVLPLYIVLRLESHDRAALQQRHEASRRWPTHPEPSEETRLPPRLLPLPEFAGAALVELYLLSSVCWAAAGALTPLVQRRLWDSGA